MPGLNNYTRTWERESQSEYDARIKLEKVTLEINVLKKFLSLESNILIWEAFKKKNKI